MKAESETEPAAVELRGDGAVVRANIQAVTRTDDGKSRTVYQYDEVVVDEVAPSLAPDLAASAEALADLAEVSDSGSAIIPAGARTVIVPHRLGVAPESVTAVSRPLRGLDVFASCDSIIVVARTVPKVQTAVDWSASGRGRVLRDNEMRPVQLDAKALSTMQVAYAAKMEAAAVELTKDAVTRGAGD